MIKLSYADIIGIRVILLIYFLLIYFINATLIITLFYILSVCLWSN